MTDVPKSQDKQDEQKSSGSTIVLSEMKPNDLSMDERMKQNGVLKPDVIEDVDEFLKQKGLDLETAIREVQQLYSNFKRAETNIHERRSRMLANVPDFESSLKFIDTMKQAKEKGKESLDMLYKLEENAFQRAKITDMDKVVLLLGASTYAEFTMEEARDLLQNNINGIAKVMEQLREELNWIRDQINTCEVSIARLHNYSIEKKKTAPKAEA